MKDAATSPALSPGGKKLVQARLPFKVVSPASPATPPTPATARKRKLSVTTESATKITKPSKENDVEELVILSDDDEETNRRTSNPYLKIVDKAMKRKLQNKTVKNKKKKVSTKNVNKRSNKSLENENRDCEDDDLMFVDEPEEFENSEPLIGIPVEVEIHEGPEEKDKDIIVDSTVNKDESVLAKATQEKPIKKSFKELISKCDSKDENSINKDSKDGDDDDKSVEKLQMPKVADNTKSEKHESSNENKKCERSIHDAGDNNDKSIIEVQPKEQHIDTNDSKKAAEYIKTDKQESSSEDTKHDNMNDALEVDNDERLIDKIAIDDDITIINDEDSKELPAKDSVLGTPSNRNKQNDFNTPKTVIGLNRSDSSMEQENNITPQRRSSRKKNPNESDQATVSSPSDIVTPKRNAKRSLEGGDKSQPASPAITALTPKQLQRKLESAKKKEEKEKERLEREKKRLEEKEERNRIRQEKEDLKKKEKEEREEQKRKEKEEKEELKRKEKEEKERQKEVERKEREEKEEQRRKEKEEKEEQKRKEKEAREEERRKKLEAFEEEKRQKELEKQEQELKIKKASAAFVNFFVPKQKAEQTESTVQSKNSMLSAFTVKSDMRLAPIVRNSIDDGQKNELDGKLESQDLPKKKLYLQTLRNKVVKPKSSQKTWPLDDKDEDCMIVDEDDLPSLVMGNGEVIVATTAVRERLRPKLLSFHESRRPPYWGTWRKKSQDITPRRPFGTDNKQLDYEVDSDSEWEDEGDGESIAGSVAGSVDEEKDEYEVDNDLFVPHGYLSDEEGTMDGEVLSLSPETQKAKLKHLEDEFEFEMKKPTEKLKPRLYGMLWETKDGGKPENCIDALWNYFGKMAMIMEDPTPLLKPTPESEETEKKKAKRKRQEGTESPKSADKRKKTKPVKKDGEPKKVAEKKNQLGINSFLTKMKT